MLDFMDRFGVRSGRHSLRVVGQFQLKARLLIGTAGAVARILRRSLSDKTVHVCLRRAGEGARGPSGSATNAPILNFQTDPLPQNAS